MRILKRHRAITIYTGVFALLIAGTWTFVPTVGVFLHGRAG